MESDEGQGRPLTHVPKVHKFGDEKSSDLILAVGTKEFWCHKKVLADHSPYFKAMFFSGFKEKDQSRVTLDDDPVAFKMLLEIIYTGHTDFHREFFCCKRRPYIPKCSCRRYPSNPITACCASPKMWIRCMLLLQLADKYDVLEKTAKFVEEFFLRREEGGTYTICHCDGIKVVIAMIYNMQGIKMDRGDFRNMAEVVATIKKTQLHVRIEADRALWLLKNPMRNTFLFNILRGMDQRGNDQPFVCQIFTVKPDENSCSFSALKPIVHKFGIEKLSDVTFIVEGEEFKCHKMFLAARSTYFKAMFSSISDQAIPDTVHLEEDAVVFSQLMEILYNGRFFGWRGMLSCSDREDNALNYYPTQSTCSVIPKLWKTCSALVNLAEKMGVRDVVIAALETCFLSHGTNTCSCDGAKFIFGALQGMHEYKNTVSVVRNAVARALTVVMQMEPKLSFDLDAFQLMMTRLSHV